MMFVYHYVIIPFHPQYLPRHAPQGGGCQGGGCRGTKPLNFLYSQKIVKKNCMCKHSFKRRLDLINYACTC